MAFACQLDDQKTIDDLQTFLKRTIAVDPRTVIRVLARPGMVGFYAGLIYPPTLLDSSATVLGMRAVRASVAQEFDLAFKAQDILSNLETSEDYRLILDADQATQNAPWLGTMPPVSGWQTAEALDAQLLHDQARAGMDAVAKALPDNPGHAVVETVRSRIWSSPLTPDSKVPTGVAFAANALGFLPNDYRGQVPVFTAGPWARLNLPAGFVLAKA